MAGHQPILTVSEVTRHLKRTIEDDPLLQDVWMRGEISNFKHHSRGHMYFTLKDEHAKMSAVMFAGNNRFLNFKPENGMKVIVRGEVNVYEPFGQYQLYALEMQPDGIGNLYLAYEQLKERLEQEGLFKEENKKPLPPVARQIAIVTSPTGAAIRDIASTIKRRFPVAQLTLLPVLVQGEEAPHSIAKAIRQANEVGGFDLLIVGRGGGSIEELWAFNEELVARAIYQSVIPIISAVGHETDYTIADFVADVRAATPTGAAELAVPDLKELISRVNQYTERLKRAQHELLKRQKEHLQRLQKSYAFRYPAQLVKQKELELDQQLERLTKHQRRMVSDAKDRLSQLEYRLKRIHPEGRLRQAEQARVKLEVLLKKEFQQMMERKEQQFQQAISSLNLLSPLRVMERGYALPYKAKTQELIKSVKQVRMNDRLHLRVTDGQLICDVKEIESESGGEGYDQK
ncbi:exodeoxyribonuclease VII large subunit [Halalkalibacterium halodurans]|uniref:Exodeoxyribonuclease 7 large subunit n=1 Tax=Halalkalibacterium halodurans (strain ATCC BAA-125 / DSM 18197 / FERM 7344 / JCM 9153 / C-125) TaxID=272558 RepID=EX7L_HALH5|nr:exodeoxyribonuclease VII large subunit [Halalkalibacterium halodurans]Q9K967.1 RecName: Full=Exodeoxyribonuclease 7 large subunit; AltName: Full=Exodeoxyribonuclease VII large subunit; Short=Exonuclease VII large subunit [Halalkalibacterium halodurans C-125]MED4174175.1 exodeoxyribonuclease VII large subunit [Halalkalibacterium halodurans]BAB06502.1 exodeoxyribonuclease VII (large subunit) [Halalkalibacterium halodurans C-125]